MNNKSIAKRLIKDLVSSKTNDIDENCQDKKPKTEPVSDGYVIVSFANRKKAQIQTATFSDVSKHSHDTINILKSQNGNEDSNIPNEDNFYGEAFWIGSENEEENDSINKAIVISSNGESDKSSQKDETDSLSSQSRPKMTRLTALSKGLLNTDYSCQIKTKEVINGNFLGDRRAVCYGGTEDGRKMLRCRECGKHYRNDYSLRHHICLRRKEVWKKGDVPKELVDGQLIYFCPTCAKPFRWMGNLTRHFYVHTGQRFFKCDICDKEFFSAYQVRRHMNSHTGLRYKCRVCEKPFTCVYACTWHMRQHTVENQQAAQNSIMSASSIGSSLPPQLSLASANLSNSLNQNNQCPTLHTSNTTNILNSDENSSSVGHCSISNSSSEGVSPNNFDVGTGNGSTSNIPSRSETTIISSNSDVPVISTNISNDSNVLNQSVPLKVATISSRRNSPILQHNISNNSTNCNNDNKPLHHHQQHSAQNI